MCGDICPICHDALGEGATHRLSCGHVFHTECIMKTFRYGHTACPVCRDDPFRPARILSSSSQGRERMRRIVLDRKRRNRCAREKPHVGRARQVYFEQRKLVRQLSKDVERDRVTAYRNYQKSTQSARAALRVAQRRLQRLHRDFVNAADGCRRKNDT